MDALIQQTIGTYSTSIGSGQKHGRPRKYQTEEEVRHAKEIRRIKNTEAVRQRRQKARQVQGEAPREERALQFSSLASGLTAVSVLPGTEGPISNGQSSQSSSIPVLIENIQTIGNSLGLALPTSLPKHTTASLLNTPLATPHSIADESESSPIVPFSTTVSAFIGPSQLSPTVSAGIDSSLSIGPPTVCIIDNASLTGSSSQLVHTNRNEASRIGEIRASFLESGFEQNHEIAEENTTGEFGDEATPLGQKNVALSEEEQYATGATQSTHDSTNLSLIQYSEDHGVEINSQIQEDQNEDLTILDLTTIIDDSTDNASDEDYSDIDSVSLNIEEEVEPEVNNIQLAVEFLAKQLIYGQSCSPEDHKSLEDGLRVDLEGYIEEQAEDDIILEYKTASLKSLAEETIMHISNSHNVLDINARIKGNEPLHHLLDPNTKNKEFIPLSTTACQQVFEGIRWEDSEDSQDGFKNCFATFLMNQSYKMTGRRKRIARNSHITYDIDSFLALPMSLYVAKRGMKFCFYAPRVLNIKQNIHLTISVPTLNGTKSVSYHKVPHIYLGNICHFEDCRLYVFFPQLYDLETERTFLTDNEYSRFINILLTTIHHVYSSDICQHLPTTWDDAGYKAKAKAAEQGVKAEKSEPRVRMLHYFLPPSGLEEVWNNVISQLEGPGLQDLGKPILLLDAKNIKTLFRGNSLIKAVNQFKETWSFSINPRALVLNQTWIDIGKEIIASKAEQDAAYTFLWRDCCLRQTLSAFTLGMPKTGFQSQFYFWALTASSSNMTFSPGKRHPFTAAGLVYSQFYGSIKEAFDAAKVFPFDNVNLEALAVDPNLHKLWSSSDGQGNHTWDRAKLVKGYIASKERVQSVLSCCQDKQYGVREEHRVSWTLFEKLAEAMKEVPEQPELDLENPPFQLIPTKDIMRFIYSNVLKFGYGFEYSLVKDGGDCISTEATKMATMFLQLLRVSLGTSCLQQNSALWIDIGREQFHDKPKQGIGLSETLSRNQYGFILGGKIDWTTWEFKPDITRHILFNHNALRSRHARSLAQVDYATKVQNMSIQLLKWLFKTWITREKAWTFEKKFDAVASVWYWFAEVMIWAFELDVLTILEKDGVIQLERDENDTIDPNSIRFCNEDMENVLDSQLSFGTEKGKSALERLLHLWVFDDGLKRQNWEDKKYRVLYKTLVTNWNVLFGEYADWEWSHIEFLKHFVRKCWIWPNASTTKWWTKCKNSPQRQWQGLKVTSLWFGKPKRWFLIGFGQPKAGIPDEINSNLVASELDDLIEEISSTAGTIRCRAHKLVMELEWGWEHAIKRRLTYIPEANVFSGRAISKEALQRTYTELQLYQEAWAEPRMRGWVLFDMLHSFCREKGYPWGGGSMRDREHHYAELMIEDSFAAKLMKETMVDKPVFYGSICKIAHTLSKGKKRKRILD